MEVKPGYQTSEFWIHLVAHFAPLVAAYVLSVVAPGAPLATAAVAAVTAVAGHFSASQYSDDRADVKMAASDVAARVVAAAHAAAAVVPAPEAK